MPPSLPLLWVHSVEVTIEVVIAGDCGNYMYVYEYCEAAIIIDWCTCVHVVEVTDRYM